MAVIKSGVGALSTSHTQKKHLNAACLYSPFCFSLIRLFLSLSLSFQGGQPAIHRCPSKTKRKENHGELLLKKNPLRERMRALIVLLLITLFPFEICGKLGMLGDRQWVCCEREQLHVVIPRRSGQDGKRTTTTTRPRTRSSD